MAERNYLVDGVSGAGKSSVYEELIRRGWKAVSTDRAWKRPADPGHDGYGWDERLAVGELESPEPDVLFVCGSSGDRGRFLPYFTKVFNLRIDDDTMRRRLRERTNNDFGKRAEELELMLALNRTDDRLAGAIDVDATQPLRQVIDDVLRLADCPTATNGSWFPPWSTRASAAVARSLVLPERAAADRPAALRGALDDEAVARLEYSWSGDVLTTLLRYLDGQGIDLLTGSRHDEIGATVSAAGTASLVVLSPRHRERYEARLDPVAFDAAALRRSYERANEVTAEGVEYALLDGIAFLRDTLAPLRPGLVALLLIG
jgi:hypothetical protein